MVCDHADQNCPFIPGATARIPLRYKDPKEFDMGAIKNILKSVGFDDLNIIVENIKLNKTNSIKENIYKDSQIKNHIYHLRI